MFISKIKLNLLLLIIASFSLSAQQVITMEEAVNIALKNNDKIKQYHERIEQKEYKDLESWGNFLPSITLSGSYNHLNEDMVIDLSPIRSAMIQLQASNQVEFANVYNMLQGKGPLSDQARAQYFAAYSKGLDGKIPAFTERFKKQDYWSANFTAVQPIFMGGKLLAAKYYAQDEKKSSEIELQQIKNEVTQDVISNYLSVVFVKDVLQTRRDVLSGIVKHRDRAKKLFEEGLIANYNVLRAEVAVSEAENNLLADNNKLKLALVALRTSMGVDVNEEYDVRETLQYQQVKDSLSDLLNEAKENQPILQMISIKKDEAKQNFNVERSNFLPTIALFGKYELFPEYLSSLEPRWIVGVSASINLFNGFKDYHKLQAASHQEKEVAYIEQDAIKKINLLVNKNYLDVRDAADRYEKSFSTINLATENLRLNEKRFEAGLGTSLDVIDAQLSLEKAKINNNNAVYDYYRNLNQLYNSIGQPERMLSVWKLKGN